MKTFPLFVKMSERRVVVIGGGGQAAAKVRLMLKTEASIAVVSDRLDPELQGLLLSGRIGQHREAISANCLRPGDIVIIARDGDERGGPSDFEIAEMARSAGALVNAVDQLDLCDFYIPSIVDRDPVVVAVGSEGNAPLLARQIKSRIETTLEPRLGELAALAGRLRPRVAEKIAPRARRAFWHWVFNGFPRQSHAKGAERDAADAIKQAIERGGAPTEKVDGGFVSLVGAGPGSRDLITLRAVQRLQEADIIFYDRLIDPDLLELARRDAERVYVGKTPGAHAWPQERINGVIASAAKQGKRVVRLKCGDPGIFGRAAEETACLDAAGVAWEIVPGVTAASAGTAAAGQSLTERGITDTLVLTTGRKRDGVCGVDWNEHLKPGTTMAIYMGVGEAREIRKHLLNGGHSKALRVDVMNCVGMRNQRLIQTCLGEFPDVMEAKNIAGPAIIVLRNPERVGLVQDASRTVNTVGMENGCKVAAPSRLPAEAL